MTNRILVWDPPKRAFHWLLAAAFVGTIGGESKREKAAKNKHGGEHGTHHHGDRHHRSHGDCHADDNG